MNKFAIGLLLTSFISSSAFANCNIHIENHASGNKLQYYVSEALREQGIFVVDSAEESNGRTLIIDGKVNVVNGIRYISVSSYKLKLRLVEDGVDLRKASGKDRLVYFTGGKLDELSKKLVEEIKVCE